MNTTPLPPLPTPKGKIYFEAEPYQPAWVSSSDAFDDDQMQAYATQARAGVASVAQQPQARPDFTDEWTGYLKDGETPFERFMRERKDLDALTKLYQRALEENERLKAQQPQAEAVPTIYVSRGQLENLKPDPEDEAGTYLPVRKTPKGKFTHPLFAAPQQAEAVPLFAALKVEGPRFHYAKVYGRIYQVLAVGSNKEDLLTVARLAKDAYYKQFPGTHEYKEPPFEWVVEEVPTAQPKFQPTEAVPFNHATQLQIAYIKGLGDGAMQAEAVPPATCRQRLAREGKLHPRSSCAVCGSLSPKWQSCNLALACNIKRLRY